MSFELTDPPLSWHCMQYLGTNSIMRISAEVRNEIEAQLRTLSWDDQRTVWITFDGIAGETVTVRASLIAGFYDSDPVLRDRDRAIDRIVADEEKDYDA